MTHIEKHPEFQNHLDRFHEVWQKEGGSMADHFTKSGFGPKTKAAVLIAKLNYQVQNGGFLQWHGNGYSEHGAETVESLKKVGGPSCLKAAVLVERALDCIVEVDEFHRDSEDDESDGPQDEWQATCENIKCEGLDTAYYALDDGICDEVEAWLTGAGMPVTGETTLQAIEARLKKAEAKLWVSVIEGEYRVVLTRRQGVSVEFQHAELLTAMSSAVTELERTSTAPMAK